MCGPQVSLTLSRMAGRLRTVGVAGVILVGVGTSAASAGDSRVAAQSSALLATVLPCGKAHNVLGQSPFSTRSERKAFVVLLAQTARLCTDTRRELTVAIAAHRYDAVKAPAATALLAVRSAVAGETATSRALTQVAHGDRTAGLASLAQAEQEGRRFIALWNAFIRKLQAARIAAGLSPI